MITPEMLEKKAEEIRGELTKWALAEGLPVGGKLVFNLRLESVPIVELEQVGRRRLVRVTPWQIYDTAESLKPWVTMARVAGKLGCPSLVGAMSRGRGDGSLRKAYLAARNHGPFPPELEQPK